MLSAMKGYSRFTKIRCLYGQLQTNVVWMLNLLSRAGVFCLLQDLERVFPVLTLYFSYIRKDRQKRKYVVLDDCPEQCLQVGEARGESVTGRC